MTGARRFAGITIPPLKHFGPLLVVWGGAMVMLFIIQDLGSSFGPKKMNLGHWSERAVWADPDLGHAAEQMRRVYDRRAEARAVAERGRQSVAELLSMPAYAGRVAAALVGRGGAA